MSERADVVVIGGGLFGTSIAYHLCLRGAGRVVLLERDALGGGDSGRTFGMVRRHYSNAVTALLMWQWQAVDVTVWHVQTQAIRCTIWTVFLAGWLMVPLVSLMINHFDLFGSRQVWLYLKDLENKPLPFRTPSLYARMRHPLYVGWMIAFWATPTMTVGHLLFAAGMTTYILIAIVFEERNLIEHFGPQYAEYRRQVPRFIPWRVGSPKQAEPAMPSVFSDTTTRALVPND